jgi:hypothetical protein
MNLPVSLKKAVQLDLCRQALRVWEEYCDQRSTLDYVETVCGTKQVIDRDLPSDAIRAVTIGRDDTNVGYRYQEPMAAIQDHDLVFPDDIELAYYSIYNLFGRYVSLRIDDDWIIVNQALSAHGDSSDYALILESAIKKIEGEQAAPRNH